MLFCFRRKRNDGITIETGNEGGYNYAYDEIGTLDYRVSKNMPPLPERRPRVVRRNVMQKVNTFLKHDNNIDNVIETQIELSGLQIPNDLYHDYLSLRGDSCCLKSSND